VLAVENCWYVAGCRLFGGARRYGAHGGGEGREHIMAAARPPTACFVMLSAI